jgi:DNA-directed RNA polymerase subunit RPC12/RpoP
MMSENEKYVVTINCNQCGERFILKGRMKKGKLETGFKRCLCNNDDDFQMEREKL